MFIRFFRRYFQHQWHATPQLLEKLNHELQTDPGLREYAQPSPQSERTGMQEQVRGGRDQIPNIEFNATGPFQTILDWLSTQMTAIKLGDALLSKQTSHQQRIAENTDENGSIWFALESWALINTQNASLVLNTQDGLVHLQKNDRLHSLTCDLISRICSDIPNVRRIQSFSERLSIVHASIKNYIDKLESSPEIKKSLAQMLSSLQPICVMRGQGTLDHTEKTFSLQELNLHYPGCYRNHPWLDWLFSRKPLDLRPELIKSPTPLVFNEVSGRTRRPSSDPSHTQPRQWWHYLYTSYLHCIPSLAQTRLLLLRRPWWIAGLLLAIGLCVLIFCTALIELPLSLFLAHKATVFTVSLYFLAIIFTWESTHHQTNKLLTDLPKKPLSAHAETYVRADDFQRNKTPFPRSESSDSDSEEEVVDFSHIHGVGRPRPA